LRLSNSSALLLLLLGSLSIQAQEIDRGYYMCPVRPGEVNYLAGTMGELRTSHFHAGIDIKTSGISGLKIYAAADGYIQRIKVSTSGYGNALYLAHPNGTYSVYGHLKEFDKEITSYVREIQYKKKSFAVDISVPKDKFKFKKGDVIALSGNSGSSSAPHLHFEIRNNAHLALNPLTYGFEEIKDTIPPVLSQVAFVSLDENSRVNGMFGRFEFSVLEKDGKYQLEVPVSLMGKIGVEVYAYDRLNGANNRNGVVKQTLLFDFKPVYKQFIDKINFATSRNILAHMNFKRLKEGGRRFNKLYVDDGNFLKYYEVGPDKGVLNIQDPLEHSIDVHLEDNYGNTRQYHLDLNNENYSSSIKNKNMFGLNEKGYDLRGNMLELMSKEGAKDCFARIYTSGEEKLVAHYNNIENSYFYLWDVKKGYPDSAIVCGKKYLFNFKKSIPSNTASQYADKNITLDFPRYSLFDTLQLSYSKFVNSERKNEYFNFEHYDQPFRKFASLTIKPKFDYDKEHSFLYTLDSKSNKYFAGGTWQGDEIVLKTRDLVKYTIAIDTIPPVIKHLKSKVGKLKFSIKDKMSGIGSYKATLDGEWVLMNFDSKYGRLWSDDQLDIEGEFVLSVEDNSGNETKWKRNF
jgi:hypothetical protein